MKSSTVASRFSGENSMFKQHPKLREPDPARGVLFCAPLPAKLEFFYARTDIIEHSRGRFWILRFGVDAQHSLRAGRAHEHPALSLKIEFLPVQVLAAFDLPFEQFSGT